MKILHSLAVITAGLFGTQCRYNSPLFWLFGHYGTIVPLNTLGDCSLLLFTYRLDIVLKIRTPVPTTLTPEFKV